MMDGPPVTPIVLFLFHSISSKKNEMNTSSVQTIDKCNINAFIKRWKWHISYHYNILLLIYQLFLWLVRLSFDISIDYTRCVYSDKK